MNRRTAVASAKARMRHGYFDNGSEIWVTCPAPCRQKVTIDRFTRKADVPKELERALADHLTEEH